MFCSNCGSQLADGSKFCPECGKALAQPAQPSAQAKPPAQPVQPEKAKKSGKKSKLPLVIIALVLVAAIAVTCVLLFGKKKVWVLTESVSVNNGQETVCRYEYGDLGVLLSYETGTTVVSGIDTYQTGTEYTYNYDDDGRIESVEVDCNGETFELEYSYDDKGKLEEITGEMENGELVAECNDAGQVETLEIYSQGELLSCRTYTYHDNGVLESVETETYLNGEVTNTGFSTYSESGKLLESGNETADGYGMVMEQIYDDEDRMVSMTITQNYEVETVITLSWENNSDGMITAPVMTFEGEADGETKTVTITGEVEYDDNCCTITLDEIDGDELGDEFPAEIEDATVEIEYGDHGYIENMVVEFDGNEFMSYSYEYTEVEVPRDYQTLIRSDPIWGMFFG